MPHNWRLVIACFAVNDCSDAPSCAQGRVAVLQALSGTGSLRVGAGFISRYLKVGGSVHCCECTPELQH